MACLLQTKWDGYTSKERLEARRKVAIDMVGVPLFGFWYLAQASFATSSAAFGDEIHEARHIPEWQYAVRLLLALAAGYVMLSHSVAQSDPQESDEGFKFMSWIGRWIFLTRNGLCLQAWHQVFTLLSPMSSWLTSVTHGASLWIATLGWFVTIQYFLLVFNHPTYLQEIAKWAERGVAFKEVGILVHVPALLIAVLDLTLARSTPVLRLSLSMGYSIALTIIYSALYFALVRLNHWKTDAYPYAILRTLDGTSAWLKFFFGQTAVMLAFLGINYFILSLRVGMCWQNCGLRS